MGEIERRNKHFMFLYQAGRLWPAHRPWLPIVLASITAFTLNVTYSVIVPPWMGPDEPRHVEYVLLLVEKGRLVAWGDSTPEIEATITRSMDRYSFWQHGLMSSDVYRPGSVPTRFDQIWSPGLTHELHQPPLYYLMAMPAAMLGRAMDIADQVRLMRLLSALLATATVAMTWLTAVEAFPGQRLLAIGATALVAFLPMHAFMGGVVNNDALAEAVGALMVYVLVRGLRHGLTWRYVVASCVLVVLGFLAKRTTAWMPLALIWAIALSLQWQGFPIRRLAAALVVSLAACALLAGYLLDALDRLSARLPGALRTLVYIYVLFPLRPAPEHSFALQLEQLTTPEAFAYYRRWLTMLFETFWARFGWVNIRIHWFLYGLLAILTLVALAGACLAVWEAARGRYPRTAWQRDEIVLLAGIVVLGFLLLIVKSLREWDPAHVATTQARFLFPVLVAIAILFMQGLLRAIPKQWHPLATATLTTGLVALNIICLLHYIIPFYRS